jgi:hypothetical protein
LLITNKYIIEFDSKRGVLGSIIILLGRGFEEEDYAQNENIPCKTTFVSQNTLSFLVPVLNQCGKHHAKLVNDNGDIGFRFFQVDHVTLHTNSCSINLESGEKQVLTVTIHFEVLERGL